MWPRKTGPSIAHDLRPWSPLSNPAPLRVAISKVTGPVAGVEEPCGTVVIDPPSWLVRQSIAGTPQASEPRGMPVPLRLLWRGAIGIILWVFFKPGLYYTYVTIVSQAQK